MTRAQVRSIVGFQVDDRWGSRSQKLIWKQVVKRDLTVHEVDEDLVEKEGIMGFFLYYCY